MLLSRPADARWSRSFFRWQIAHLSGQQWFRKWLVGARARKDVIGYVKLNLLLGGEQYAGPFLPALNRQTDTLDVGTSALDAWRLFVASNLTGFDEYRRRTHRWAVCSVEEGGQAHLFGSAGLTLPRLSQYRRD